MAAAHLERFPDGVFFVDLAPVTDVGVLPATVAEAVGFARLALGTGSGRPSAELLDYLSAREVLLVIDNCEHLIDACAGVDRPASWSAARVCRCWRRVVRRCTSRASRPTPCRRSGLAGGSGERSEAAELFAARAALVRPDFVVLPADVVDVEEICRRLDGIPLAIELAAAQIAHLSPRQISGAARRPLPPPHRRPPTARRRQQTLHAALDWSHDLLEDGERRALRRLAVFPGTFTERGRP